jgi:hypothetical protein
MKRPILLLSLALFWAGCEKQEVTGPEVPTPAPPAAEKPKLPFEPVVIDRGVEPLADDGAMVTVTTSFIMVDGQQLVPISGGEVPASEREGGAFGMKVPKLTAFMRARAGAAKDATAPVRLLVDPATSAGVLFAVIVSARDAGARAFRLVVARPDGSLGVLPIELPDARASTGTVIELDAAKKKAPPPDAPAGLVVSLTRDKLLLWSLSGLEGTIQAPKLAIDAAGGRFDLEKLTASLAEIAQRRWPDAGRRPADSRSIIIQVDRATRFDQLAAVISATRTRPDGNLLFPDVLLSVGFD